MPENLAQRTFGRRFDLLNPQIPDEFSGLALRPGRPPLYGRVRGIPRRRATRRRSRRAAIRAAAQRAARATRPSRSAIFARRPVPATVALPGRGARGWLPGPQPRAGRANGLRGWWRSDAHPSESEDYAVEVNPPDDRLDRAGTPTRWQEVETPSRALLERLREAHFGPTGAQVDQRSSQPPIAGFKDDRPQADLARIAPHLRRLPLSPASTGFVKGHGGSAYRRHRASGKFLVPLELSRRAIFALSRGLPTMGFAMLDQPARLLTSRAGLGTARGTLAPGRALRLAGDEGRLREFTVTLRYAQLSPDQVCEKIVAAPGGFSTLSARGAKIDRVRRVRCDAPVAQVDRAAVS